MAITRKPKFTIIQDTREQEGKGWNFRASANANKMKRKKLDVGDYCIEGMENIICIERKTIGDLWSTLGLQKNYERFLREWDRAKNHQMKYLIIEGTVADINRGYQWSKVSANLIHAKLTSLQVKHNVHVIFAGRKDVAQSYTRSLLDKLYRYYLDGILKESEGDAAS